MIIIRSTFLQITFRNRKTNKCIPIFILIYSQTVEFGMRVLAIGMFIFDFFYHISSLMSNYEVFAGIRLNFKGSRQGSYTKTVFSNLCSLMIQFSRQKNVFKIVSHSAK